MLCSSINTQHTAFFKCQVCAVAGAFLKLSADYGALFSYSDEQNVHLMAQFCPICQ
jgi:hypothetical protein